MLNRYLFIDQNAAENLIHQSYNYKPIKTEDSKTKAYYVKNYIVLHKTNIPVADSNTLPTEEYYYDVMLKLMKLYENKVSVVPILGYTINENTIKTIDKGSDVYASGYVILAKQRGDELYSYDKMPNPFSLESTNYDSKKTNYLFSRLKEISNIPQNHYDKYVSDFLKISKAGLKFDVYNQSNILYNKTSGFIFSNINHKLQKFKTESEFNKSFIRNVFAVCCINFDYSQALSATEKAELKELNTIVYGKCLSSLVSLGFKTEEIEQGSINIWKN